MAARSTLTVTSGTTITSAWGNSVRNHLVPYTTSNDVSSEGQLAVNTSTKQLVAYNGSSAVRLGHYTSAGRTWVSATDSGVGSIATATTVQMSWSASSDADGFYTGWDGTRYAFTVPSGLGGVYAIIAQIAFSTTWTPSDGGDWIRIDVPSVTRFDVPTQPNSGGILAASIGCISLSAADKVAVSFMQSSGSSRTVISASFQMVRLCI
jgi:hypothetical protein